MKRFEPRKKIIEKRISENSGVGKWLNKLKIKYGDKFSGWSKPGSTIFITNIQPANVINIVNPSSTSNPSSADPNTNPPPSTLRITLRKNTNGKFKRFYLIDVSSNEVIPITVTFDASNIGTADVTATVAAATPLKNRAYKLICVDSSNIPYNEGGINLRYPWGVAFGSPRALLPNTTSIDQSFVATSANAATSYTYYTSDVTWPINTNFLFHFDVSRNPATVNSTMVVVGVANEVPTNTTVATHAAIRGAFVDLYNGTIYNNTLQTGSTTLKGPVTWTVYPSQFIICGLGDGIYAGPTVDKMYRIRYLQSNPWTASGDGFLRVFISIQTNSTAATTWTFTMKSSAL